MKNSRRKRALALLLALCLALPLLTTAASAATFPAASGYKGNSIVDGLKSVGANSSFSYRAEIAAANGISGYRGTAAQNTKLLNLLRQGKLVKPGSAAAQPPAAPSWAPAAGGSLIAVNWNRVSFIRQDVNTCKATAAAMACNLIAGTNKYSTKSMQSSPSRPDCKNLQGFTVKGSDGHLYSATYRFDPYQGSRGELVNEIERSLASGLPIVAAVHSRSGKAPHHWILVVGKQNGDYLCVDPWRAGSGSIAGNVKTMKSLNYDLGLTDYSSPRYGYISFRRVS